MKMTRFAVLALLVLCFALLFTACDLAETETLSPDTDAENTTEPNGSTNTDSHEQTTDSLSLSDDAQIISTGVFSLNDTVLSATVPNETEIVTLVDQIRVSDKATWEIRNEEGSVLSGTVTLQPGDNTFSVLVTSESGKTTSLYTVRIRRRPLYTVIFDTNGGTTYPPIEVEEDSLVPLPEDDPVRPGFSFLKWSNTETPVKGNETVTAKWRAVDFPIIYNLNGGTNAENNPATYTIEDDEITLAAPSRTGYTFAGWSNNGVITTGSTGEKSFTASWTIINYPITYTLNGGSNAQSNPATYTIEDDEITLAAPSRTGYTFAGWSNDGVITTGSTGEKSFTASWTVINYPITYTLNGGSNAQSNPATYTIEDDEITLAAPTRTGYSFAGWSNDGVITTGSTGEKSFTASWTVIHYPITYNLNGGTNNESNPATYTVEGAVALADPTRNGYTFLGWSDGGAIAVGSTGEKTFNANWMADTDTQYTVEYYLENLTGTGFDKTLTEPKGGTTDTVATAEQKTFAHFTFLPDESVVEGTIAGDGSLILKMYYSRDTYTVTFVPNGGTLADGSASQTIRYGNPAAIPTFARTGYEFAGWDDASGCAAVENDLTVTALWTAIEYTISYNLNGGINAQSNPATYTIEDDEITLAAPSRTGYTFAGWSNDGTIAASSTGEKAFTASWTVIEYTITYNLNGGTNNESNPATYTIEDDEITLAAPSRTGYTFAGWSDGGTIALGSTGAKSFVANWTIINYPITYTLNGGTNSGNNPATYTVEDEVTLSAPSRDGYAFAGWSNGGMIALGSTGAKNFAAEWEIETYSITYNSNGGDNDPSNPVSYTTEDEVVLCAPTRNTYQFIGWYSESGEKINNLKGHTGDLTLTARWVAPFTLSGGTITGVSDLIKETVTELTIPSTFEGTAITAIGDHAFAGYTGLASVTIPEGITEIGSNAFDGCTGLISISLPDSMSLIAYNAFSGCSKLDYLIFDNCRFLGNAENPYLVLISMIDKTAASCTIPETTKIIYAYAFQNCSELSSIVIPDSIVAIGRFAFSNCSGLQSVTIGIGINDIGYRAFSGCNISAVHITDLEKWCNISFSHNSDFGDANPLCHADFLYLNGEPISDLVIPETVTAIKDMAFFTFSGLTSVTIPDNVTIIGYAAFDNCPNLTEVSLGNGITRIEDLAFYNCKKIDEIIFPNTLTYIGYRAFGSCHQLSEIVIPDSVSVIGDHAFSECSRLTSVTIGKGVTVIQNRPFANSHLTSITVADGNPAFHVAGNCLIETASKTLLMGFNTSVIPTDGSVTCIGPYAFCCCYELSEINIPNSVTRIEECAFSSCNSLVSVVIPDSVTAIGDEAFRFCANLTSFVLGKGVTRISAYMLGDCAKLASLSLPQNITSIGRGAFSNCVSLSSLTIPEGIATIPTNAFWGAGLTSLTIPSSVTHIDDTAFLGCSKLTSIVVADGNPNYHSAGNCLIETASKKLILGCNTSIIPNDGSVLEICKLAFSGLSDLTEITIPDGVKTIGEGAFQICANLTSVVISDSVTSIGEDAFSACPKLTSVTLGNGITRIESRTFSGCVALQSIVIPDSVTAIGDSAFYNCASMTSLTIGNNVVSIGERAFRYCYGLTQITIPESVTSIRIGAFLDCPRLAEIHNLSSLNVTVASEENGSVGFYAKYIFTEAEGSYLNKTDDGFVFYDDGVEVKLIAYQGVEPDPILPDDCNGKPYDINEYAFYNCTKLTSIAIPDSVTSIGDWAFYNCYNLTTVTFSGTKAQWNAISKGSNWDAYADSYTIRCTDGIVEE